MFTREQVQIQRFQQTAFSTDPGAPSGILVPRDADFNIDPTRNFLDNPQVQSDGHEREPALGNFLNTISGRSVPNLAYFGHILKALCTTLTTTGVGPYNHVGKLTPGTVLYNLFEAGIVGGALWYKHYDMVMSRLGLSIPVEGIMTVQESYEGSGHFVGPGGTSLDATPTEVTGTPLEYANFTILEDAADPGDILDLSIDVDRKIAWKRPHGKSGKASEARYGKHTVRGRIRRYFESDAAWLKARNGTLAAIKATVVSSTSSLEALMNEVKTKPVGPKFQSEDGIEQEFEYYAIKKANADSPIMFTLINDTASY